MGLAVAIWSQVVQPGVEPEEFAPQADLRLTNVALGDELADENGRTVVKLIHLQPVAPDTDDEDDVELRQEAVETVLCSLIPGKIEQVSLDIVLQSGETIAFQAVGKNTVHLTGNFIEQRPYDLPPDEDELLSDQEEEALRLEDVSSDVEVPMDEADELMDDSDGDAPVSLPPPKSKPSKAESKKRAREEDVVEPAQPSKKDKKSKKQKTEGGQAKAAVPPPAPEPKKTNEPPQDKKDKKKKKKKSKPAEGQ